MLHLLCRVVNFRSEAWLLRLKPVREDRPHIVSLLEPFFLRINLTYTSGVGPCVHGRILSTQETSVRESK